MVYCYNVTTRCTIPTQSSQNEGQHEGQELAWRAASTGVAAAAWTKLVSTKRDGLTSNAAALLQLGTNEQQG